MTSKYLAAHASMASQKLNSLHFEIVSGATGNGRYGFRLLKPTRRFTEQISSVFPGMAIIKGLTEDHGVMFLNLKIQILQGITGQGLSASRE